MALRTALFGVAASALTAPSSPTIPVGVSPPAAAAPACNLAGLWRWNHNPGGLEIWITMVDDTRFDVALKPPTAWKSASGVMSTMWDGVAVVNMTASTGMPMNGFIYNGCSLIEAGDAGSGLWYRNGSIPPRPPPPPPPSPPPTPAAKPGEPDVVWETPSSDVTGSMPLGNGRLGVNVWADATSTMGLLLSHVDALDENFVLSKLARVRLRALPGNSGKLWQADPAINSGHLREEHAQPRDVRSMEFVIHQGTIGGQPPMGTVVCPNVTGCPNVAAEKCVATAGCTGFGLSPKFDGAKVAQLYSAPLSDSALNYPWTLWQQSSPTPGPPPKPVQPFRAKYYLSNMTVRLQLPVPQNVTVDVWVDGTTDAVRVFSSSTVPHRLEATLEIWRNESGPYPFKSTSWCTTLHQNVTRSADTVVSRKSSLLFYHQTPDGYRGMWPVDLASQQMPKDLPIMNSKTMFGGLISGGADSDFVSTSPMQLTSAAASITQTLSIAGTAGSFSDVESLEATLEASLASRTDRHAHAAFWDEFWDNARLEVTTAAAPNNSAVAEASHIVTLMDRINKAAFYSMAMGHHAIKFNAYGIYSAYSGPGEEDYRVWGECQWFQNIRLPYYHMLHDGRYDAMKSLFEFYYNLLPVSVARTKAWYNMSNGGSFFPETLQQNGLYASGAYGWDCHSADPHGPLPGNTYIRYHREGGLELSLLALDWFLHTGDVHYFQTKLLPQITSYVAYYAEHFEINPATGKLDIFPAQALETWQCETVPPSRGSCVTDPMPEIAGLRALLPQLLQLNDTVVPAAVKSQWQALLLRVPPLPVGDCTGIFKGSDAKCLRPGRLLPPKTSNSENAELYAVHPYKIVGLNANRTLGITSFYDRKFHGDTGWSEDFMDAALLGLANETAEEAIRRATVPPYNGYRWIGFQAGIGAGGPITDHGGVAMAGLRYMLLQTGIRGATGTPTAALVLFPAWPCLDWAVHFKLHAPGGTVLEGVYNGAGKLLNFSVTPPDRMADVVFADCIRNPVADVQTV